MRRVLFRANPNRVPGIGPATVSHHDIRLLGEEIDDLAFAFIPPLQAENTGVAFESRYHGGSIGRAAEESRHGGTNDQ
jgi:hypothetical protein